MVRIVDWILLGACTLSYALPQQAGNPAGIVERNEDVRTITVTHTFTGIHGATRTRTNTFTNTNPANTYTKTHSRKTKSPSTPSPHTTSHSYGTTQPVGPTKTITTNKPSPTYHGTPGTCGYAASAGGVYTDSHDVTYNVNCGAAIAGVPFATTPSSSFSNCLSLCSANANCVAFQWTFPVLVLPGQCLLFDVSVSFLPSVISDAAIVVSR